MKGFKCFGLLETYIGQSGFIPQTMLSHIFIRKSNINKYTKQNN